MNKEQIYDTEIAPHMTQIIAICKRSKIAVIANFQIPIDNNDDLQCTTALLKDEYSPSKEQLAALALLKPL